MPKTWSLTGSSKDRKYISSFVRRTWSVIHITSVSTSYVDIYSIIDTTSRTLDATLGFLALNAEFQEEVYREIVQAMPTKESFVSDPINGARDT